MTIIILDTTSVTAEFDTTEAKFDNLIIASSTVRREILFVAHHSLHHLAMIKLILQHMNYDQKNISNLGVAPSTILHKEASKI